MAMRVCWWVLVLIWLHATCYYAIASPHVGYYIHSSNSAAVCFQSRPQSNFLQFANIATSTNIELIMLLWDKGMVPLKNLDSFTRLFTCSIPIRVTEDFSLCFTSPFPNYMQQTTNTVMVSTNLQFSTNHVQPGTTCVWFFCLMIGRAMSIPRAMQKCKNLYQLESYSRLVKWSKYHAPLWWWSRSPDHQMHLISMQTAHTWQCK